MPSIRDFSGGVVNQELLGKDGGAGVIIDANNVLSSWNGELRKRTGTRIITQLDKKSRIVPYRLPNNDDALLIFSDNKAELFELSGEALSPINNSKDVPFPTNGWSSTTNGDWTLVSNLERTRYYDGKIIFDYANPSNNYFIEFQNKNAVIFKTVTFLFTVVGNRGYLDSPVLQFSDDGKVWVTIRSNSKRNEYTVKTQIIGSLYSDVPHTEISVSNDSQEILQHKYWRVVFLGCVTSGDKYISGQIKSAFFSSGGGQNVVANTNFSNSDLDHIKHAQYSQDMYITCSQKQPIRLSLSQGAFSISPFIPSSTTDIWTKTGEPSSVASFQNRLVFGGFKEFKNRVIMSEFGNPENFSVKTTDVKSTDPISVDSVEIRSKIENLWAGNNALYALSSDGVSMIDAQGGVIATDQINFKLRNRESADGMTPTTKDDIMIYLGNDRRKIFITDYDFIVQRFKAKDLSIGYNGFLTSRIVALHYASRKCSLIYGYKDDGNMLALLFDVDLQKNALFPCDIGGDIKDMQVFKSGDKFRVLMVAQIENRWYLVEKNEQPEYTVMDFMTPQQKADYSKTVVQDGLYLDYMTRRYYNEPTTVLEDLPYGVGEYVAVFADGVYIGEKICSREGPFAWTGDSKTIYTKSSRPFVGDPVYNENNEIMDNFTIEKVSATQISVKEPAFRTDYAWVDTEFTGWIFYTKSETPKVGDLATTDAMPGRTYPIKSVGDNYIELDGPKVGVAYRDSSKDETVSADYVVSEYIRNTEKDLGSGPVGIRLDYPATDFVLGYNYDAYAVLKLATPYASKKYPKEVATYLINTGYLEIGNSFDNLQPILNNMRDKLDLFDKPMLLNGEYTKTMDKLDNSPYIILRSKEPMPFMITGIDFKVDYSNYQGGI